MIVISLCRNSLIALLKQSAKKQQIINFPVFRGRIYTATKRPH